MLSTLREPPSCQEEEVNYEGKPQRSGCQISAWCLRISIHHAAGKDSGFKDRPV